MANANLSVGAVLHLSVLSALRVGALFALVLLGATAAHAQPVKELPPPTAAQLIPTLVEFRDGLIKSDAAVDALLDKTYREQLSTEQRDVMRRYVRTIMSSDAYIGYVARAAAGAAKAEMSLSDVKAVVANSVVTLQVKGLARMPAEAKLKFAQHLAAAVRSVSPSTCKALFNGQLSTLESSAVEVHFLLSLPTERLSDIVTMYAESALAELNDYPSKSIVTAEESRLADGAYRSAMRKRMQATLDSETIAYFAKEGLKGDAQAVCPVMLTALDALQDLDEPFRTWKLTAFVDSMQ